MKRKKITNKININNCDYQLFGRRYCYNPLIIAHIKYYWFDENTDRYVAQLGVNLIGIIVRLATIVLMLLLLFKISTQSTIDIIIPNVAYSNGQLLEVNIVNNSDYDMVITILQEDNPIASGLVQNNSSVAYIDIVGEVNKNSFSDITIALESGETAECSRLLFIADREIMQ